jgi:hypothetical protein
VLEISEIEADNNDEDDATLEYNPPSNYADVSTSSSTSTTSTKKNVIVDEEAKRVLDRLREYELTEARGDAVMPLPAPPAAPAVSNNQLALPGAPKRSILPVQSAVSPLLAVELATNTDEPVSLVVVERDTQKQAFKQQQISNNDAAATPKKLSKFKQAMLDSKKQ